VARPVLEVHGLCVEGGPAAAFRDVTFAVEGGRTLCILGGEGAGKSQLLRCLGLDFPPTSGSIEVQGVDVTGVTRERRRQLRARTIQLVHPPAPAGVRDLTVPGTRTGLLIQPTAGASAPAAGMRQRIQIAKALTHGADVLLLDEPLVGVEHGVRLRILELLERLRREAQTAVVVATRDPEVARALADDIVVLDDGDVIESGPATRVLDSPRHHRTRTLVQSRRSA
jgi:ABC-type glutathione transport system ATPase component